MFDSIINAVGSEGIKKLTNSNKKEIEEVFDGLKKLDNKLNHETASRCEISLFDLFFIIIKIMKHCGAWDMHASIFTLKVSRFQ